MADPHGHLPKADPEQLSPELRQRLAVWFDKAYRDDNLFLTLVHRGLRHPSRRLDRGDRGAVGDRIESPLTMVGGRIVYAAEPFARFEDRRPAR